MRLVIINGNPKRTIFGQQRVNHLEPVTHQREPERVLDPIIVMGEGAAGVIGRIDKDTLHPACKLGFQGLQSEQVVALNEHIVEDIPITDTLGGVVAEVRVCEEDAGLEAGAMLLADPGELELLLLGHGNLRGYGRRNSGAACIRASVLLYPGNGISGLCAAVHRMRCTAQTGQGETISRASRAPGFAGLAPGARAPIKRAA